MPVSVAVLDSDVLVPIVACDFLLTAADLQLYEPILSATALEDVQRSLLEDFPDLDLAGLLRRVDYMRAALTDQIIDTQSGEHGRESVNEKNGHVVAAALISVWRTPTEGAPCGGPAVMGVLVGWWCTARRTRRV